MSSRRKTKANQTVLRRKPLSGTSFEQERQKLKKERHNNVEKRSRMKFNNLLHEMKNVLLEAGVNMQNDPTTAMIIGKFTEHLEKLDVIKQKLMIKVETKMAELETKCQSYHRSCCQPGNLCFSGLDSSTSAHSNTTDIFTRFEEAQFQQYNEHATDDSRQENNLVQSSTESEGLLSVATLETLGVLASNYEEQLPQLVFQQFSFNGSSVVDHTVQHIRSFDSLDPVSVDLDFDFDLAERLLPSEDFNDQFQQGHFDDLLNWNLR